MQMDINMGMPVPSEPSVPLASSTANLLKKKRTPEKDQFATAGPHELLMIYAGKWTIESLKKNEILGQADIRAFKASGKATISLKSRGNEPELIKFESRLEQGPFDSEVVMRQQSNGAEWKLYGSSKEGGSGNRIDAILWQNMKTEVVVQWRRATKTSSLPRAKRAANTPPMAGVDCIEPTASEGAKRRKLSHGPDAAKPVQSNANKENRTSNSQVSFACHLSTGNRRPPMCPFGRSKGTAPLLQDPHQSSQ